MRLFLALWPPDRVSAELALVGEALAELAHGKAVPAEKIHLTLAFLGEVGAERVDAVRGPAAEARAAPFDLVLDHVGAFRKARVAWAGSSGLPAVLIELQSNLDRALRAAQFPLDDRPFAAHVTLARKIARPVPPAPMPQIRWPAKELVLARTETGTGRYSILERWSLDRD
jgi:2'-5' RNA ligase